MSLDVRFVELKNVFSTQLSETKQSFGFNFGDVITVTAPAPDGAYPLYTGAHTVTPKTEEQTLRTAMKSMQKDVTVKAIPYYETSNTSGGSTVYIGTEVI